MRFGFDLHQHVVPEWAKFYFPYDLLKISFKSIVERSSAQDFKPDFSDLYKSIATSVDTLSDFSNEQWEFLVAAQEELSIKYGLQPGSSRSLKVHAPRSCKKQHSCSLAYLHKNILKLQFFYRVNEQAVDRIYEKIARCHVSPGELHETHKLKWIKQKKQNEEKLLVLNHSLGAPFTSDSAAICCDVFPTAGTLYPETITPQSGPCEEELLTFEWVIKSDDPSKVAELIRPFHGDARDVSSLKIEALLYHLVELSMIHKSGLSAQYLLVEGFSATGVIPDHSLLNIILISASQKNHLCDHLGQPQDKRLFYKTCGNCEEEHPLTLAVEHLCSVQKDIVFAKDYLGRLPLHYGALYGREAACKTILRHAKVQGQGSSHILSPDARGYTPFHYAVVENNFAVAQVFLNALVTEHERDTKLDGNHMNKIQELLNISIRYQLDDMVLLLGASQLYSGKGSGHEESPLYVAAEIGREDYLQILLDNGQVKNIDDSEKLHGWSALFIACVKGHRNSVKVLLRYGASQEICDSHGWYAKEHAFLRGHFSLTELFKPWDKAQVTGGPASMHVASPNTAGLFLSPKVDHVIVNIGVLQHIGRVMGVDLGISSSQHKAFTGTTPSVDMSISVGGSVSHSICLPVLNDLSNEPLIFPVDISSRLPIIFKFFQQSLLDGKRRLIGSAVTLLQNELEIFGINRESLLRARTIPILESDTCESLGTVTFTFLIIKGNAATNEPAPISSYVPEKTTQLVGHRGFGQNSADRSHLQLGENTVQSMLSAAKQGASYVEFDVQLTRDLVPVIFHDFSLSESGTDIPIHDLTFKQFMLASNIQSPREASELIKNTSANHNLEGHDRNRSRSRSLSAMNAQEIDLIHDRMRFTVDFKNKGFKPNTRGDSIHGPFTTLEKLLVELPESISFNAEIKYPRIHEAVEAGIAPVGLEINEFVDRILDEIFRNARGRKIILSSFTPEICILLTVKQQKYPVMFITNAGKLPANDMETRASSLQAAVRFSKRWDLAGIVFASDIFLLCPRLVGYVKQSGFVCGSYGTLNNDPESVRLQQAAGIQMLMADRVGFVSKVLNEGI